MSATSKHKTSKGALSIDLSDTGGIIELLTTRLVYFVLIGALFGLPLWSLIQYGENHDGHPITCRQRAEERGFRGNGDFYGLGIRLGVYLQWTSQMIANTFKLRDWKVMLAGASVFNISLTVATYVLTFRHACTYTAEIIVILYIYWGGLLITFYGSPFARMLMRDRKSHRGEASTGTAMATSVPLFLMSVYSLWFWLRLATVGEGDFAKTPHGSYFFLFDRVSVETRAAVNFLVFASFYVAVLHTAIGEQLAIAIVGVLAILILLLRLLNHQASKTLHSKASLPPVNLTEVHDSDKGSVTVIQKTDEQNQTTNDGPDHNSALDSGENQGADEDQEANETLGASGTRPTPLALRVRTLTSSTLDGRINLRPVARALTSSTMEDPEVKWVQVVISTCSFIYSIIAVELTLVWNGVSGVYSVASTGQIIPLVGSATLVASLLWQFDSVRNVFEDDSKKADGDEESRIDQGQTVGSQSPERSSSHAADELRSDSITTGAASLPQTTVERPQGDFETQQLRDVHFRHPATW